MDNVIILSLRNQAFNILKSRREIERAGEGNVRQVSGDLCRSVNSCNRTGPCSFSCNPAYINGRINPTFISDSMDSRQRGSGICVTFSGSFKRFAVFFLGRIRDALLPETRSRKCDGSNLRCWDRCYHVVKWSICLFAKSLIVSWALSFAIML